MEEVDCQSLHFVSLNDKSRFLVSPEPLHGTSDDVPYQLLAVSVRYGKLVVPYRQSETRHGFCVYDADACAAAIRSNSNAKPLGIVATLADGVSVTSLLFIHQDEVVLMTTSAGDVMAYALADLCSGNPTAQTMSTLKQPDGIKVCRAACQESASHLFAILLNDGRLSVGQLGAADELQLLPSSWPDMQVIDVSWHPSEQRLAAVAQNKVYLLQPGGNVLKTINLDHVSSLSSVVWLDHATFLLGEANAEMDDQFIVYNQETSESLSAASLVYPDFGVKVGKHVYHTAISSLLPQRTLHILLAANSIDLACLIRDETTTSIALLPDTPRFETPMSKSGAASTYPRGLALDDGNSVPVRAQNAGDADLAPRPLLWCLTDEGALLAYQCISWADVDRPIPMQKRLPLPARKPTPVRSAKTAEPPKVDESKLKEAEKKSPVQNAPEKAKVTKTSAKPMLASQQALKAVTSKYHDDPISTILLHLKGAIEETYTQLTTVRDCKASLHATQRLRSDCNGQETSSAALLKELKGILYECQSHRRQAAHCMEMLQQAQRLLASQMSQMTSRMLPEDELSPEQAAIEAQILQHASTIQQRLANMEASLQTKKQEKKLRSTEPSLRSLWDRVAVASQKVQHQRARVSDLLQTFETVLAERLPRGTEEEAGAFSSTAVTALPQTPTGHVNVKLYPVARRAWSQVYTTAKLTQCGRLSFDARLPDLLPAHPTQSSQSTSSIAAYLTSLRHRDEDVPLETPALPVPSTATKEESLDTQRYFGHFLPFGATADKLESKADEHAADAQDEDEMDAPEAKEAPAFSLAKTESPTPFAFATAPALPTKAATFALPKAHAEKADPLPTTSAAFSFTRPAASPSPVTKSPPSSSSTKSRLIPTPTFKAPFSFAHVSPPKEVTPSFSFAKVDAPKEKAPSFSFAKADPPKEKAPSFSFAKVDPPKEKAPSFGQPSLPAEASDKKDMPAFGATFGSSAVTPSAFSSGQAAPATKPAFSFMPAASAPEAPILPTADADPADLTTSDSDESSQGDASVEEDPSEANVEEEEEQADESVAESDGSELVSIEDSATEDATETGEEDEVSVSDEIATEEANEEETATEETSTKPDEMDHQTKVLQGKEEVEQEGASVIDDGPTLPTSPSTLEDTVSAQDTTVEAEPTLPAEQEEDKAETAGPVSEASKEKEATPALSLVATPDAAPVKEASAPVSTANDTADSTSNTLSVPPARPFGAVAVDASQESGPSADAFQLDGLAETVGDVANATTVGDDNGNDTAMDDTPDETVAPTTSAPSTFGGQATPSAFGASAFGQQDGSSAFGGQQNAPSSTFGGQQSSNASTFGGPQNTNASTFGGQQNQGFGGQSGGASQPMAFGSASSTFGAGPTQAAFGGSSAAPFGGGNAQPAFGAQTPAKNPFASRSVFGQTPSFGTGSKLGNFTPSGNVFGVKPNAFGASSQTTASSTAFGQSLPFGKPSAFGSPQTQQPSATPNAFGSPQSQTNVPSAFGAPPSTTSSNAFNQQATAFSQPSFGQSSFGAPQSGFGTPAFGAPSQAPSAFGAPSQPSSQANPSAFGQAAFGQSSFGQPAAGNTPGFGQSAFGQSSFGQGAAPFGSNAPKPFGANAGTSGGGGGFSAFAKSNTAFGASGANNGAANTSSAPAAKPAFTQYR